jgi:hypothetical protein
MKQYLEAQPQPGGMTYDTDTDTGRERLERSRFRGWPVSCW